MATNKSSKKSNVSKSAQLTKFKFRWWMALILVGVVAIIGIVILRFSNASGSVSCIFYSGRCEVHYDDISRYQLPGVTKGYDCVPRNYVKKNVPYTCRWYSYN